jgi:hypothetical protein
MSRHFRIMMSKRSQMSFLIPVSRIFRVLWLAMISFCT